MNVGVGLPAELSAIGVEVALVGLLTGGRRVGIVDDVGVKVGIPVGVAILDTGGGQVWSLIVNCRQSLP